MDQGGTYYRRGNPLRLWHVLREWIVLVRALRVDGIYKKWDLVYFILSTSARLSDLGFALKYRLFRCCSNLYSQQLAGLAQQ